MSGQGSYEFVETRPRGGRIIAAVCAVFWGFFFYGLIDLSVFLQGPEFHSSIPLETGWGLFFVFLVAAPFGAIAVGPRTVRVACIQQVLLATVAISIAAALSASKDHLLVTFLLLGSVGAVAAGGCGDAAVFRRPHRWSWGPGVLVVASAGPWSVYAISTATETALAEERGDAPTLWLNHWPVQAALGIGILLAATLVATFPSGWAVPTWCVGACATWLGIVSWIYPDLAASLGRPWGAATVGWCLAFIAVTHLAALRTK